MSTQLFRALAVVCLQRRCIRHHLCEKVGMHEMDADRSGEVRDLVAVRQPVADLVRAIEWEYLRLVSETAGGGGVEDSVEVRSPALRLGTNQSGASSGALRLEGSRVLQSSLLQSRRGSDKATPAWLNGDGGALSRVTWDRSHLLTK